MILKYLKRITEHLAIKIWLVVYFVISMLILWVLTSHYVNIYSIVFYNWTFNTGFYPRAVIGSLFTYVPFLRANMFLIVYSLWTICFCFYLFFLYKVCIKYENEKYFLLCSFVFMPLFLIQFGTFRPELYHLFGFLLCLYSYDKLKDKIEILGILYLIIALVGITIHQGYVFLVFPFTLILLLRDFNKKTLIIVFLYCFISALYFIILKVYMLHLYKSNPEIISILQEDIFKELISKPKFEIFGSDSLVSRVKYWINDYIVYEFKPKFIFQMKGKNLLKALKYVSVYFFTNIISFVCFLKLVISICIKNLRCYSIIVCFFFVVACMVGVDFIRWLAWYYIILRLMYMYYLLHNDVKFNIMSASRYTVILYFDLIAIMISGKVMSIY